MNDNHFAAELDLGGRKVGPAHPVLVIAEVGVNHNGDRELAKRHIAAAAAAGADAVKFQAFTTGEFMADRDTEYEYREAGGVRREKMYDMFKRLELDAAAHRALADCARDAGIMFLSTPCDPRALAMLLELGVPAVKISSEDLINPPLLAAAAACGKPLILSTGMADAAEIDRALAVCRAAGARAVALLHCTAVYPTPPAEANLLRLVALRERYGTVTGYSDHTDGDRAALAAVALGACLIEKHFTLSRELPGPDQAFSIEPEPLRRLVAAIRAVEQLRGRGGLAPAPAEMALRLKFRRSIVAACDLAAGTVLAAEHLAFRRPGDGLKPYEAERVLGRTLVRARRENEQIRPGDVV